VDIVGRGSQLHDPARSPRNFLSGNSSSHQKSDWVDLDRGHDELRRADDLTPTGGDTTPPAVSLIAPAGGSIVFGQVTVTAAPTAASAVAALQFKLDRRRPRHRAASSPYTLTWTPQRRRRHSFPDGRRSGRLPGYDDSEHRGGDRRQRRHTSNGLMTAPAAGATVSGTAVVVSATAADNVGVAGVQFILDGAPLGFEVSVRLHV